MIYLPLVETDYQTLFNPLWHDIVSADRDLGSNRELFRLAAQMQVAYVGSIIAANRKAIREANSHLDALLVQIGTVSSQG